MAWMSSLYGMRAGRKTINNQLFSRGCRVYRPTRKPMLTANHRRLHLECAQRWQNQTMLHWPHVIFEDESRFQLYPVDGRLTVCHSPVGHFQQRCQAYRVQAGGGSVHVWIAFNSGAKTPLSLLDRYMYITSELYRDILRNTSVPFARQHIGHIYC